MAEHCLRDHMQWGLEPAGRGHKEAAGDSARHLSVVPRADSRKPQRRGRCKPGKMRGHKQVRARGVGRGGWQGTAQPPRSWRALKGKCAEHQGAAGRVKTPHQQLCGKAGTAARDTGMGSPGQDGGTPLLWGQGGCESMSACGGASGNRRGSAPFPVGGELISGGGIPSGASRGPRGLRKGMGRRPRRGEYLPQ